MHHEPAGALYAFDITLHGLPATADAPMPSATHEELGVSWPTVSVPRAWLSTPMSVEFDVAIERLGRIDRMYAEPDGSLVWTSPGGGAGWQVDGNAYEKDGRVLHVDLRGSCPAEAFDRLLACFGWPQQRVIVQLLRPGVFLEEEAFRRHALARGAAGDGETLRPS